MIALWLHSLKAGEMTATLSLSVHICKMEPTISLVQRAVVRIN